MLTHSPIVLPKTPPTTIVIASPLSIMGSHSKARQNLIHALQGAHRLGVQLGKPRHMKPLVAPCRFGRLRATLGQSNEVASRARDVVKLYQDMGMNHWANYASQKLGLSGPGPEGSLA